MRGGVQKFASVCRNKNVQNSRGAGIQSQGDLGVRATLNRRGPEPRGFTLRLREDRELHDRSDSRREYWL
jgi:hypothetical protein